MDYPARNVADAWNAVDLFPLAGDDPRYVECSPARGGENIVNRLLRPIERSQRPVHQLISGYRLLRPIERSQRPVHQLISGYRGCGKSTELLRLVRRLQDGGYFVVYFEADDSLDVNDLEYTDLLIGIVRGLEAELRKQGVQVRADTVEDVQGWLAETVYTWTDKGAVEAGLRGEISLEPGVPLLAKLLAKITGQLKTSREAKREVRLRLDPQVSQLLDRINLFIADASAALQRQGKRGLVVVIDNLDRIPYRVLDEASGRSSHEAISLEHADQLKALNCYVVYTVPIALFSSPTAALLTGAFPEYHILPMIQVRDRDGDAAETGLEALGKILRSRVDSSRFFPPDVLKELALASGGVLRDFMRLLRYCLDMVEEDDPPVSLAVAWRAFQRLVNEYGRMVPEHHWRLLADVHRSRQVLNDADHQLMLHNLSVLEYMNEERWCDVHPAVQALPQFRDAPS